ncbi:MAG: OB-fold nucleic acid binding domain-containing protein [Acidimicrobiia bacterium]
MALRKFVDKLTKPVEELDRQELTAFCDRLHSTPIDQIQPRVPTRVAGEIRSVRIVPRAGADALEVTVSDGRAAVTGVFLGRRKIGGLSPGRKVVLEGVVLPDGKQHQIYNPIYTLL